MPTWMLKKIDYKSGRPIIKHIKTFRRKSQIFEDWEEFFEENHYVLVNKYGSGEYLIVPVGKKLTKYGVSGHFQQPEFRIILY